MPARVAEGQEGEIVGHLGPSSAASIRKGDSGGEGTKCSLLSSRGENAEVRKRAGDVFLLPRSHVLPWGLWHTCTVSTETWGAEKVVDGDSHTAVYLDSSGEQPGLLKASGPQPTSQRPGNLSVPSSMVSPISFPMSSGTFQSTEGDSSSPPNLKAECPPWTPPWIETRTPKRQGALALGGRDLSPHRTMQLPHPQPLS